MKNPTLIATAVSTILFGAGLAFSQPADDGANLGQATEIVPPLPAPQPKDESTGEAPARQAATAEQPRSSLVEEIRRLIDEGRYDVAVRLASLGIAREPDKAADYRRLRARAYALAGRYEEALADAKPIQLTVTAPRAALKSGNDVVDTVEAGTQVEVTEVRGDWLRVASAGDRKYDWAWIWKGHIEPSGRRPAAVGRRPLVDVRVYADGYRYRRRYYDEPPRYYPPSAYAPYYDYGRLYYDWWQHVPPQYWRYLPR